MAIIVSNSLTHIELQVNEIDKVPILSRVTLMSTRFETPLKTPLRGNFKEFLSYAVMTN